MINVDDFMSRFNEMFVFDFSRASVRKAGNSFIDYSNCAAEKKPFALRMFIERIWSCTLLTYHELVVNQQLVSRLATTEEDRDLKIDYFNMEGQPVGHKIRTGHINRDGEMTEMDAICVRYQPCYGLDDPRTKDGRDYLCLINHSTVFTKTAVFDPRENLFSAIHQFSSDEFLGLVQQLDEDWGFEPLNYSNRKWCHPNGSTVQWVKKEKNFHKYIYYIPFRLFSESYHKLDIPRVRAEELKRLHRAAWDQVADRYINIEGA